MAVTKKKRTKKVSKGLHGAKKYPLDPVSKVLLGKGLYTSFVPAGQGQRKKPKED